MTGTAWQKKYPERAAVIKKRSKEKAQMETGRGRWRRWTQEERELLKSSKMTDKELAKEIDRSFCSISSMRLWLKRQN